jgi:hypothetical protein
VKKKFMNLKQINKEEKGKRKEEKEENRKYKLKKS